MSKRVLVLDESTGRRSYTNHPEKLIRRGHAAFDGRILRVLPVGFAARLADHEADVEFRKNHGERVYWNGSDVNGEHLPGQLVS